MDNVSVHRNRIPEIFDRAIGIDSTEARDVFLDQQCGEDKMARRMLDQLLNAHIQATSFLNCVEPPSATMHAETGAFLPELTPETQIGNFRIEKLIGEGGFGLVYSAEQLEPVRRQVAIKLIKPGMDTRELIRRFRAERQALALMEHPAIAKIFEAGATEQGQPFFAMELCAGSPVRRFCDQAKMPVDARLELFCRICDGVQHAHQKGIIHRDLKPSNILISMVDGVARPKIIDFGIAKAIGNGHRENGDGTLNGLLLGTPDYMSPEQAAKQNGDIDIRSDIYSLGVVLFELVSGTTPAAGSLQEGSGSGKDRPSSRDDLIANPGQCVSGDSVKSGVLAEMRSCTPAQLKSMLNGDLKCILLKSLEKDRDLRYQSVGAFKRDLQRFLAGEPVEARGFSRGYQLRKFASRNKSAMLTAFTFVSLLVLATVVSLWQNIALREARNNELARRLDAEGIYSLLETTLASPRPDRNGRKVTVVELMEDFENNLEQVGHIDDRTKAKTFNLIVSVYLSLGLTEEATRVSDEAMQFAERVGANADRAFKLVRFNAAECKLARGEPEIASRLFAGIVDECKGEYVEDDPLTIRCMGRLGYALMQANRVSDSREVWKSAYHLCGENPDLGEDSIQGVVVGFAEFLRATDDLQSAESILKNVLNSFETELPPPSSRFYHSVLSSLGRTEVALGKYESGLARQQRACDLKNEMLGPDHIESIAAISDLGQSYGKSGDIQTAVRLLEDAVRRARQNSNATAFFRINIFSSLGTAYVHTGRLKDAEDLFRESIADGERAGLNHNDIVMTGPMHNLGFILQMTGRSRESIEYLERAMETRKKQFGLQHSSTMKSMFKLATALLDLPDRKPDALKLLADYEKSIELAYHDQPQMRLTSFRRIIQVLWEAEQFQQVRPFVQTFDDLLSENHSRGWMKLENTTRVIALRASGDDQQAGNQEMQQREELLKCCNRLCELQGTIPPRHRSTAIAGSIDRLLLFLESTGGSDEKLEKLVREWKEKRMNYVSPENPR